MLTPTSPGAPPCSGRTRLATMFVALLPLAALMLALDLGLGALFGPVERQHGYSALSSADAIRETAARVAAVQAQLAAERPPGPPLAVVLGLSTAREGIAALRFQQAAAGRYRLLNLAASGGSFSEMADYCKPLLDSALRPEVVIVAVHPSWLAGRVKPEPPAWPLLPADPDQTALLDYGRAVRAWLVERSWILSNRSAIHERLREYMAQLRHSVGVRFAVTLDGPARSMADPWKVVSNYSDERAPPAFLATQLAQWRALGWFDAGRLHAEAADAPRLRGLLQSLRAISPKVVLVLMPESEPFRQLVPSEGVQTVYAVAASVGVTVLDLRASMPISAFRDQAHLNAAGRQVFSDRLARELLP